MQNSSSMKTANKSKGTVLIIDDDRMIVDLVKMAFAGDGYQVVAAQSGTELNELLESIDLTRDLPFDLILLDLLLPDTSGEALYHILRANATLAKIPIIILSAAAAVQKRIQLLKMGADDYIIKPFNVDDLLMRASVHIKLGKMRQAKDEVDNRMRYLEDLAQAINSDEELDQILVNLLQSLKALVYADNVSVFLPADNQEALAAASIKKLSDEYLYQAHSANAGITAYAIQTGTPCLVNNVQEDGRFDPAIDQLPGQTTNSLICVPIKVNKDFICVLRSFNQGNGEFTADDLSLAVSAANLFTIALKNNYLYQLLESANQDTNETVQV